METELMNYENFFDQIDDLIEFPSDNECNDCNLVSSSFPTWDEALQFYDPLLSRGSASFPYEDLMPLEWLSTFVEGSFSTLDNENTDALRNQFRTSTPLSSVESNSSSSSSSSSSSGGKTVPWAPQRARSKRPRPAPSSSGSDSFIESPSRKRNNEKIKITKEDACPALVPKCSHCGVTKTPQWRAGSTGPKTLCNACGVRFKSGRLFPEYRPAASPTFVPALHSNSHKKVIEMRGRACS